jgi:hypothetical protein
VPNISGDVEGRFAGHPKSLSSPSAKKNLLTHTIQREKPEIVLPIIAPQIVKIGRERKSPPGPGGLSCFRENHNALQLSFCRRIHRISGGSSTFQSGYICKRSF